jgi:hypothetical protein
LKPSIGRIVHYFSYGTPGGEYKRECRAACITEVYWQHTYDEAGNKTGPSVPDPEQHVSLAVYNPTGMFFNGGIPFDEGPPEDAGTGLCGGRAFPGGTWHWPAREDG